MSEVRIDHTTYSALMRIARAVSHLKDPDPHRALHGTYGLCIFGCGHALLDMEEDHKPTCPYTVATKLTKRNR